MRHLLLLAACLVAALPGALCKKSACADLFGPKKSSLLMFADPGDFSGSAESHYLMENLQNKKEIKAFSYACGKAFAGTIMGQRVALVTTGIGPQTSGICTTVLLEACGAKVKEAIYMGTSGWSAAVGGVVTPQGPTTPNASCSAPATNTARGQNTRVGDLCVTPYSNNWMCKQASWTQQCAGFPNLCSRPKENWGPSASFLYGQCFFTGAPAKSMSLVNELLAVAASAAWSPPPPVASVFAQNSQYWNATNAGTGSKYTIYNRTDKPTVYGPTTCMETDGQFFYSGVPWEITARDYVAEGINIAFNYTGSAMKTALDVIAVSAMEAVGFGEALERYHKKAGVKDVIPYTNVRGNSNWLHHPVRLETAADGSAFWSYETIMPDNFGAGYGYAIASYSSLTLGMFQKRCTALGLPATTCKFTLTYAA